MKRYDPDGNEKRRAKKGERRCGECVVFRRGHIEPSRVAWPVGAEEAIRTAPEYLRSQCCAWGRVLDTVMYQGHPIEVREQDRSCRADDYAGDCKHFSKRNSR